jgi:hypothetical protein
MKRCPGYIGRFIDISGWMGIDQNWQATNLRIGDNLSDRVKFWSKIFIVTARGS